MKNESKQSLGIHDLVIMFIETSIEFTSNSNDQLTMENITKEFCEFAYSNGLKEYGGHPMLSGVIHNNLMNKGAQSSLKSINSGRELRKATLPKFYTNLKMK